MTGWQARAGGWTPARGRGDVGFIAAVARGSAGCLLHHALALGLDDRVLDRREVARDVAGA